MTLQHAAQRLSRLLGRGLLIGLSLACLLGQAWVGWGWSVWWLYGLMMGLVGVGWYWAGPRLAGLIGCLVLSLAVGQLSLLRVLDPALPPEHIRQLDLPQKTLIEGRLYREPERLPHRTRLYLEVTRRYTQDGVLPKVGDDDIEKRSALTFPAVGRVLISVRFLSGTWQYGDVVRLPVRLRAPRNFHTPGSFDYEGYLARRGIYVTAFLWDDDKIETIGTRAGAIRGWLEQTRRRIGTFFDARLDSQNAAILRALIIGDASGIDTDLRETFARAGVAHVLAISGLHIGFVAAAAYGAWWWLLSRSHTILLSYTMPKLAALLSVPPVLLYAGLAGGRVATWRALIMVLVYLLAILLGRQREVYRSLACAALLISVVWPGAVLEVSFQLSFVSVLAIFAGLSRFSVWWEKFSDRQLFQLRPQQGQEKISLTTGLHEGRYQRLLFRWGVTYCVVSGCAIVGTAPITAAHFNQIAIAGFVANLVIIPLLGSAAVLLGLATAVLVFVHEGLASLLVLGAGVVAQVAGWIVNVISAWPYAAFDVVTPSLFELVLIYGIGACLFLGLQSSTPVRYVLPVLFSVLLADCAYWTWQRFFRQDLRVTFLDVGQGDAAVVEFPGSRVMVIDGGGFASPTFDSGEAIIAPFLWGRKIGRVDTLVMSHPQLDHYGGLAFLAKHFGPSEFWSSGEEADSERFERLRNTLERAGVVTRVVCRDSPPVSVSGVRIGVLHPPCQARGLDTNSASVVLRLSHGDIDFLLPGDIEADGEKVLLESGQTIHSEILKVPHHGSRSSSTAAFVQAVLPQVAIASLGLHNRFGFPASEVVQRYRGRGTELLRTDRDGAVSVISDGTGYTLELPFAESD